MQLYKDKHLYTYYLGEDIVWELFSQILALIHKFAPSFKPWHGISSAEDRISNATQIVLQESLHHDSINTLLGATMAQKTATINEQYRVGLKQISRVVQDIAVYSHNGQRYIGYEVNQKLRELLQVCYSVIFINSVDISNVLTNMTDIGQGMCSSGIPI